MSKLVKFYLCVMSCSVYVPIFFTLLQLKKLMIVDFSNNIYIVNRYDFMNMYVLFRCLDIYL